MPKPKPPARPKAEPTPKDAKALLASVAQAKNVAGLEKIVAELAKLATPEAHAALWALAIDPPQLPFKHGLDFIAMKQLDAVRKRRPDVRALFIDRCAAAEDTARWNHALLVLGNIAYEDKRNALADRKLCAALRRTIGFETGDLSENAIYILGRLRDEESLPAIVAQLAGCTAEDVRIVKRIAEAMVEFSNTTAADFAKLRALRASLKAPPKPSRPPFEELDKLIAKLAKRFP